MEHNASCLVEKNSNGLTPFHITIQGGKLRFAAKASFFILSQVKFSNSILNFIMSNYVNATYIRDHNGSTGLHIAAAAGHTDIVDRLLRVRSSDNSISTW